MQSMTLEALIVNPADAPDSNPRDGWPEWTDRFTWELGPDPEDDNRPTVGPDFEPTPEDAAYDLGYSLALADEEPDHKRLVAGMGEHGRLAYWHGYLCGNLDLARREQAEREEGLAFDAWVSEREDEAFGSPADRMHEAERVEAVGSILARGA